MLRCDPYAQEMESRRRERELALVKKSLQWTSILQVGRKLSPESYCFTVEMLEPLRLLNCSEYAIEQFNALSVKYIQVRGDMQSSWVGVN